MLLCLVWYFYSTKLCCRTVSKEEVLVLLTFFLQSPTRSSPSSRGDSSSLSEFQLRAWRNHLTGCTVWLPDSPFSRLSPPSGIAAAWQRRGDEGEKGRCAEEGGDSRTGRKRGRRERERKRERGREGAAVAALFPPLSQKKKRRKPACQRRCSAAAHRRRPPRLRPGVGPQNTQVINV